MQSTDRRYESASLQHNNGYGVVGSTSFGVASSASSRSQNPGYPALPASDTRVAAQTQGVTPDPSTNKRRRKRKSPSPSLSQLLPDQRAGGSANHAAQPQEHSPSTFSQQAFDVLTAQQSHPSLPYPAPAHAYAGLEPFGGEGNEEGGSGNEAAAIAQSIEEHHAIHVSGPPRNVNPSKRAEQNRKAQRAFRERRDQHIKELEAKSAMYDNLHLQLEEANRRLEEYQHVIEAMKNEQTRLIGLFQKHTGNLPLGYTAPPHLSLSIVEAPPAASPRMEATHDESAAASEPRGGTRVGDEVTDIDELHGSGLHNSASPIPDDGSGTRRNRNI